MDWLKPTSLPCAIDEIMLVSTSDQVQQDCMKKRKDKKDVCKWSLLIPPKANKHIYE